MNFNGLLLLSIILLGCTDEFDVIDYKECELLQDKMISFSMDYETLFRSDFSITDFNKVDRSEAVLKFDQIVDGYQKCRFQHVIDGRKGISNFEDHLVDIQMMNDVVKNSLEDDSGRILTTYQQMAYFENFRLFVDRLKKQVVE